MVEQERLGRIVLYRMSGDTIVSRSRAGRGPQRTFLSEATGSPC